MKKPALQKDARQPARKLELRREKIRELGAEDLEEVRGGVDAKFSYGTCMTISG